MINKKEKKMDEYTKKTVHRMKQFKKQEYICDYSDYVNTGRFTKYHQFAGMAEIMIPFLSKDEVYGAVTLLEYLCSYKHANYNSNHPTKDIVFNVSDNVIDIIYDFCKCVRDGMNNI